MDGVAAGKSKKENFKYTQERPLPDSKFYQSSQTMAEGQPAPAPGGTKRPAPAVPLAVARAKFSKAQQEQQDAEARLQESQETLQTRAAGLIKALRKGMINKAYQNAWTKMQTTFRDKLWETSTRIGTRKELEDLIRDARPPGSHTYLFRWALKKGNAPIEEMLVIECALHSTRTADTEHAPGYEDLAGTIYLEYHGQRTELNGFDALRTFFTYVGTDADQVAELSDEQLIALYNDCLVHVAQDVVKMAQVLIEASFQEFPPLHIYYQVILSDVRASRLESLFSVH